MFRKHFRSIASFQERLLRFQLAEAECYCCSAGHVDTGDLCDREVIARCIRAWFGSVAAVTKDGSPKQVLTQNVTAGMQFFLEGDIVAHLAVLITSKEARVNSKRFAERCWEHPFSGIWDRTCFLTNYTWSLRVLCFGAFWITRFSIGWSCKLQEAPTVKYLTSCCFFKVFCCFWLATSASAMEEPYITLWSALRTTWVWVY